MRSFSGIAFALAILVSSAVCAQTATSQPAAPQTARQALIEMFFGQGSDHLEKHLSDNTLRTYQKLGGTNGQGGLGAFSMFAMQAKSGKDKFETFDTGSNFLTAAGPVGASYDKMEITVERDELVGDQDQIELALHLVSNGKDEAILPYTLRFTFSMKMESEVWRLHEVAAAVRFPIADPAFLKVVEEQQLRQNEQTALLSVRAINAAQKSYQSTQAGFACTLSTLGSAGKQSSVARRIYLYDPQLAGGKKNGYNFALSGCDTSHYQLVAEPELPDSGVRAYCSDESGVVRSSSDGKASTCLVSGEVVEEKVPAANIRFSAPAQGKAVYGTSQPEQRVHVSQGVSAGLLINRVPPIYPPLARQARIQGTVVLKAMINQTGDVVSLELISGHPVLAPAAIEAVKQWKYRPYVLNGNAVDLETQVEVNFTLSEH
jgi:TonB family protein